MNYLSQENMQEVLNLSPTQEYLFLQDQSQSGTRDYICQKRYMIKISIEEEHLQKAWAQVVQFHSALRTVFRYIKKREQPVQVILKVRPFPIDLQDVRNLPFAEQQSALEKVSLVHQAPFNLAEEPLIRLALFLIADYEAILVCTYHQVLLDDYSLSHVIADLFSIYTTIMLKEIVFENNRRPYREYLEWLAQQDWMSAKEFWASYLTGLKTSTPLLLGECSASHQMGQPLTRTFSIEKDLSQALEHLDQNVSSQTLLQAAWAILLSIYNNENEVIFGMLCPARPKDLQHSCEMIGRFANTLPIRISVDGNLRLREFLEHIQREYEKLTNVAFMALKNIQSFSEVPANQDFFHSILAIHEEPVHAEKVVCYEHSEWIRSIQGLAIHVILGEEWKFSFSCSSDVLASDSIDRIAVHLQTLLRCMVENFQGTVSELNILPSNERNMLLVEFNQKEANVPLDKLAYQVIEDQAARRPDAVAVVHGSRKITYRELNARANRMAHWLRANGFGRETLAAVFGERDIDMLVSILAIIKAGGAFIPLDTAYPDTRLSAILTISDTKFILTQHKLAERILTLIEHLNSSPLILFMDTRAADDISDASLFYEAEFDTLPVNNPESINQLRDLANVYYTSGSTGLPKGAMIEHVGMLNHLWSKIQILRLSEKSIVAQNASHCFDIFVWQSLAPLMVGGKVVIYDNLTAGDPEALFSSVQRDKTSILELVPAMLEMFLQVATMKSESERGLPDLQYLISSGETLPVSLCHKWFQAFASSKIINAYGATECSDDTTYEVVETPPSQDMTYMSVGKPIANFNVYILDRWLRPVPLGCVGEICFTGIGVGRGYLNDPNQTRKSFLQNPFNDGMGERMYRTGDLGQLLPDGRIIYRGRFDRQVKVRGHRIELGEIEACLSRHDAIKQCAVIVRSDAQQQSSILAYVVLGKAVEMLALREFVKRLLPDYMVPDHFMSIEALPLDHNGKVDRKSLPGTVQQSHTETAQTAPRNETEKQLAKIWEELLELSPIHIDDTFFELGGHSLKIIQMRFKIKKHFSIDIDIQTLFEQRTIRMLAAVVDSLCKKAEGANLSAIQRYPSAPYYSMSHGQRRLWFLRLLSPHDNSYNMTRAWELEGILDVSALKLAIDAIIERHGCLRTTFKLVNDEPVQIVARHGECLFSIEDLCHLSLEVRTQRLQEIIKSQTNFNFDLVTAPPFRLLLVKLKQQHNILFFTMHHIIGDAWSWQVLEHDLVTLYNSFHQGKDNPLQPLSIQYTDYTYWHNERLVSGHLEKEANYWQHQFAGELPVLNLPLDHPRPNVRRGIGSMQSLKLDTNLVVKLHHLCQRNDATLFSVLLTALGVFLHRMSGQEDIIVGTPAAGRTHVQLEDQIGFFLNTLPFRFNIKGNPSFLELLRQVKHKVLNDYAHQEYPFDLLVERINPVRELSHLPLFSVLFQVNRDVPEVAMENIVVKQYSLKSEHAKFDLTIAFVEKKEELECTIEYDIDLFEEATISRMLGHFSTLLKGIVHNAEQHISELPILTETECRELLTIRNNTRTDYSKKQRCFHELFEEQVSRTPESIAVMFKDRQLTYRELNVRANQLAHHLQKLGIGPQACVGMCMQPSLEMVIGLLGILEAGGAFLPLDPAFPQERIAFMLHDTHSSVLLTQEDLVEKLPVVREVKTICLDTGCAVILQESVTQPARNVTAENIAYIIYTSGSTGKPKGVVVSHRSFMNYLIWCADAYGARYGRGAPMQSSIAADAIYPSLFAPLLVGTSVVLLPKSQALQALSEILQEQGGFSLIKITPTQLEALNQQIQQANAARWVRTLVVGAEALRGDILNFWQRCAPETILLNEYGPTETVVGCSIYRISNGQAISGAVPIGLPIANTQFYVLDAYLQPVPVGVPGELYIGGDGLAWGYLNRPDLTAAAFIPHPFSDEPGTRLYKTGDLVRYLLDREANIEFLGRIDHQVKIRGYRVELGEIEAVLAEHPVVEQVVVITREDEVGTKQLIAYVVFKPEATTSPNMLKSYLSSKLPDYMIPVAIVELDSLPLTITGKVNLQALPAADRVHSQLEKAFESPRNSVEKQLAHIWCQVLGIDQVGIHDNFFELGGDSILSIRIIARANESGLPLTPKQLFQHQTIAQLAVVAGTTSTTKAQQELILGPVRLTPIHCWFFEQQFTRPDHYNQSMLLEVQQNLEAALLKEAIQALLIHHDSLRLRARRNVFGWQMDNTTPDGPVPFSEVDLSMLPEAEQKRAFDVSVNDAQMSLNISEGPLVRVVLYRMGQLLPDLFLIIIHHIAIDIVSWNILLEDLQTACRQLSQGKTVQLPPKTTSFQLWARRLNEYAQSVETMQEVRYWLSQPYLKVQGIPIDYAMQKTSNTEASASTIEVSLTTQETDILLHEVPKAYHTQINDVLLTALVQTFAQWTGTRTLLVDLERHGREPLFENLDVSRTVGWFTSIIPVLLDLEDSQGTGEDLMKIKEQLRSIPSNGIGYGLLRYLREDEQGKGLLRYFPSAQVSFNYRGHSIRLMSGEQFFVSSPKAKGFERNAKCSRNYYLEVDGAIVENQLRMFWTYSKNLHYRHTIETLATLFIETLRLLILHCQSSESGSYTPSDFPLAQLNEQKLHKLARHLDKYEEKM